MKTLIVAAVLALAATAASADPVLGTYKTQPDDNGNFGHVEIYSCDGKICGVIRKAFNGAGQEIESENIGKRMIWDMESQGGGRYAGGKIWAPDRNKVYNSKMELSGADLSVSGCVAILCRSQAWTAVR